MSILTHGRDMTLAPTITPLVKQTNKTVRGAVSALIAAGFESVQLDATLPGIRPRDLNQRGRRDLQALLTRSGVRLAGLDMFVPRSQFLESEHLDRAIHATLAGIELAADLGRVPMSIALPVRQSGEDVKNSLVEAADGHGIRLAVHAEDQLDDLLAWVEQVDLPALGCGIDPASFLAAGKTQDPVGVSGRLGKFLAVARLSDLQSASALRCAAGAGDLDVGDYRVTLDLAPARAGPVVLDLRGQEDALGAANLSKAAWENAAFTI